MTCDEKLEKTLCSTAMAGRTRRNGFKLQQGQFDLGIKKQFVIAGLLQVREEIVWAGSAVHSVEDAYKQLGKTCIRNDMDIATLALKTQD